MDGKYQTRDGRAVRILCVDRKSECKGRVVAGLVTSVTGKEEDPYCWHSDGKYEVETLSRYDLVPVPTKHEMWAVVYPDGEYRTAVRDRFLFSTEVFARDSADWENRIPRPLTGGKARVAHVTWED
jgi:hypothetical protein